MAKRKTVGQFEVEELACKITGLDYDEIDADETIIDDKLVEVFGCTLGQFVDLINELLPLIDVGKSELTGNRYKGFADTENKMWLTKIEA